MNKDRQPAANQVGTLFSTQGQDMVLADTTDANGNFHFAGLNYYDSTRFSLQVSTLTGRKQDMLIQLDPPLAPRIQSPVAQSEWNEPAFQQAVDEFRKKKVDSFTTGNTREW